MQLSDFSIGLKNKLSIYVPSTCNVNQVIDNTKQVEKTACFLSKLFGGCTVINSNGFWISACKELVKENTTICFAYCSTKDFLKYENEIIDFVKTLCFEMSQECISVSFNNELFFIS